MRFKTKSVSPAGAAFLSFLFPGLGQVALGKQRRGLYVALPAIVGTVLLVGILIFARHSLIDALLSDNTISSLLLINLALLLYRLWATLDAYQVAKPRVQRRLDQAKVQTKAVVARAGRPLGSVILGALLVATVGTHLAFGVVVVQYKDAMNCVFNTEGACWFDGGASLPSGATIAPYTDAPATDAPSSIADASATASGQASAGASATQSGPPPTPGPTTADGIPIFPVENVSGTNTAPEQWAADGKLNILLAGVDEGVGRVSLRTDTMILLEVDIATGRSVMYGIPRNLENVPLPPEAADAFPCHCFPYPNLLNGLWRDAYNRPSAYPYAGTPFVRGFKALEGAIGQYLGLHVDGAVVVNLMGFVNLIDALGGLDINVPVAINDSQYSRPQDGRDTVLHISAGQQHMNGYTALAYARSRHQDSDYGRMSRQQAVLIALRSQLHPCALLPKIGDLTSALGSAFWTDMPIDQAPALVALAEHVGSGNVKNIELVPAITGNPVGFLTVPRLATVRDIVAHGLDGVPAASGTSGSGSGGGLSC